MIFGRTELIIGASKAKNDQESFAEVHLSVAHQNPDQNSKKQNSESGKIRIFVVRRRKIKCWGEDEMGVAEVGGLYCECLRSKCSFQVLYTDVVRRCTTLYAIVRTYVR